MANSTTAEELKHWSTDEEEFLSPPVHQRNWFCVRLDPSHFNGDYIPYEIIEWLTNNTKSVWDYQKAFTPVDKGTSRLDEWRIRMLFRSKKDAALFRLFWGC
jgi:hypothetical protein